MSERRNDPGDSDWNSQIASQIQTRINLLFTMSEIPHARPVRTTTCEVMFSRTIVLVDRQSARLRSSSFAGHASLRQARLATHSRRRSWWSQTGSNRRPHACKARALPAELWPRTRRRMLQRWRSRDGTALDQVVGLGRLELPTSRLSSARSNQLSYKPLTLGDSDRRSTSAYRAGCIAQALSPWRVFVREERETKTAKSRQWSSAILKLLAPDVSKTIR